ncbi:MAG: hypothetical protein WCP04_03475 [Pseudomonadota bacterium]|jgi:hypothetical protein
MQTWTRHQQRPFGALWLTALLALAASASRAEEPPVAAPAEATVDPASQAEPPGHLAIRTHFPRQRRGPQTTDAMLAERVRLLAAELDLNPPQQQQVGDLLKQQAVAIRRVWSDRSLTDGERGPITSLITEKTADGIRAVLTPQQREKYNPPRPDTKRTPQEQQHDLSKWLDAMQQK